MGKTRWRVRVGAVLASLGLLTAVPVVIGSVQNASAEVLYIRGINNGQIGMWVIDTGSGNSWFLPD